MVLLPILNCSIKGHSKFKQANKVQNEHVS